MTVIYEKKKNVAYITLNRPEAHNAVDPEMVLALVDAWEDYQKDGELRCAILTGGAAATFCSGADLSKLVPLFTGTRQPETEADRVVQADPMLLQKALLRDLVIDKPIIAAINGSAIAGGMELLYSTDIRIVAEGAKLGLQEAKWSIFPLGGSSVKLFRQVPYAMAMEILLTGELFDAQKALTMGFVNYVLPQDQVLAKAEEIANIIAANGPLAVSAIKKAVRVNIGKSLKDGLKKEMELAIPVILSEDAKEGPKAFKEKRVPQFKGR